MKSCVSLLVALVIFSSGCASIVSGSSQKVSISSSPEANVVIFDKANVKVWNSSTPTITYLNKGDGFFGGASYRIEITKEGYEKQTINISSSLSGWYLAGNFVFGGLIGWIIVDPLTGAMWTLDPENINVDLSQSLSFDDSGNVDGIYIVLKEQIPDNVFESLELVKIN